VHEPTIATPAAEAPLISTEPGVDLADDPRSLQILTTEHWSLLSARGLAYNEAFTRAGMFLAFLSMSFVGLALLAQAMGFSPDFLVVAAIVLAFDVLVGAATFGRIAGTGADDLRALHGMNRIRHGYIQIAPHLAPYFTTGTHDDVDTVLLHYGPAGGESPLGQIGYGLTTSGGMVGLITSLVAGLLGAVVTLALGGSGWWAIGVGALVSVLAFAVIARWSFGQIARNQAALSVLFPAPSDPGE